MLSKEVAALRQAVSYSGMAAAERLCCQAETIRKDLLTLIDAHETLHGDKPLSSSEVRALIDTYLKKRTGECTDERERYRAAAYSGEGV